MAARDISKNKGTSLSSGVSVSVHESPGWNGLNFNKFSLHVCDESPELPQHMLGFSFQGTAAMLGIIPDHSLSTESTLPDFILEAATLHMEEGVE